MSPETARILVDEVLPRIRSAVPNSVKRVGCEDVEELTQDTVAQAAMALESCEVNRRPIYPASVAYFAIQRAKCGRRSYGATRTDVLCPAAALDGNSTPVSMDEDLPSGDEDTGPTLHDQLAAPVEGPDEQGARELDWESLLADLDDRQVAILRTVAEGGTLSKLAQKYHVSPAWITMLKQGLGGLIKLRLGDDVLADVARRPRWAASVYAQQEADACRHARSKDVW